MNRGSEARDKLRKAAPQDSNVRHHNGMLLRVYVVNERLHAVVLGDDQEWALFDLESADLVEQPPADLEHNAAFVEPQQQPH